MGLGTTTRRGKGESLAYDHATYANVSRVPSTRSMYSFSSKWSIAWHTRQRASGQHKAVGRKGAGVTPTHLLDIRDLRREPLRNLLDDLLD